MSALAAGEEPGARDRARASRMEDQQEIYRRVQLGGRVGYGESAAVLVIDFQPSFTAPSTPGGWDFGAAISATSQLLGGARALAIPVIFTVVAYDRPSRDAGRFIEKCPTLAHSVAGSPLVKVDSRLDLQLDEVCLTKKYASAFFGTSLGSLLVTAAVDTVIVCGCTTSGCVRATVVDAMQYGYRAIVPRECVADIARTVHEANLFDIDAKYGDVTDLDSVLERLPSLKGDLPGNRLGHLGREDQR